MLQHHPDKGGDASQLRQVIDAADTLLSPTRRRIFDSSLSGSTVCLCNCGEPAAKLTVKKEGPNCRRQFFTCSDRVCKFFEWAAATEMTSSCCYVCGESGHVSSECRLILHGTGSSSSSSSAYGIEACFTCGQQGHWARDCPKRRRM